jgi:hypothetical protein
MYIHWQSDHGVILLREESICCCSHVRITHRVGWLATIIYFFLEHSTYLELSPVSKVESFTYFMLGML